MPKPYDATLKHLIEWYPLDWLRLLNVEPDGDVSVVDSDVSTVTAAVDKVYRIEVETPWLVHIEFQASHDPRLPERMHYYNTLLSYRHGCAVKSVAVLLRQSATGPTMTGTWTQRLPAGRESIRFQYEVLCIWDLPADALLEEGPGVLPLAILADDAQSRLSDIIAESKRRVQTMPDHESEELLTAEYVLAGLRYALDFTQSLFHGVRTMRESVTYQGILEEGHVEYARKAILMLGRKSLGEPDDRVRKTIDSIEDIHRLDAMLERVVGAASWDEVVA